jgi:uncharacterized RDD family membrane protein YckC
MTNIPPGPGWWIASDGRWYPPESHPSATPSPWSMPAPGPLPAAEAPWSAPPQPAPWNAPPPGWDNPSPGWANPSPGWGYGPPAYPAYGAPSKALIDPALGLPLAPWWKRLCAILIDWLILAGVGWVFSAIAVQATGTQFVTTVGPDGQPILTNRASGAFLAIELAGFVIAILYYGLLNGSRRGQTVGKRVLRIAVRDAQSGTSIGRGRALGRYAITLAFALPFGIPFLVDSLAPLWDKRRQAWHDHVVRSVVVEVP